MPRTEADCYFGQKGRGVKAPNGADTNVLFWLAFDFVLIPCKPATKELFGAVYRNYKTPDRDTFEFWFNRYPNANWAIRCGTELEGGRVVVLDLDSQRAIEAYQRLSEHRVKAPTCTTKRGLHLLFLWPSDIPFPRGEKLVLPAEALPDSELILNGCALIPPSTSADGQPYEWLVTPLPEWAEDEREGVFPPPKLPQWLLDLALRALPTKHCSSEPGTKIRAPKTLVDVLACSEGLACWVAEQLDTSFLGHGKNVRCPFHRPDRHPSAAWYKLSRGQWALHDFHDSQTWLLADLAHYVMTKELKRVSGGERYKALVWAAHKSGLLRFLTAQMLEKAYQALLRVLSSPPGGGTDTLNREGCMKLKRRRHYSEGTHEERKSMKQLLKVWQELKRLFLVNAEDGFANVIAPTHVLARKLGLKVSVVCRSINLLCALGILVKVRGGEGCDDPPTGNFRRAQRLTLCDIDPEDVERRWEKLGRPNLRKFNGRLVAERLGEDVETAIFLARPGLRALKEEKWRAFDTSIGQ